MKPLFRAAAAAALAVVVPVSAFADAPELPLRSGEVTTPSALAKGENYVSISKSMTCELGTCSATLKGRKNRQLLITQISCITFTENGEAAYGAATESEGSQVALALFPIQSRTVFGTTEYAVVGGSTQIVLDPAGSFFFGVGSTGVMQQAVCTLTGTATRL